MKIEIKITKRILEESKYCNSNGCSPEEHKIGQNCAIGKSIFNLFGCRSWVCRDHIKYYKKGINWLGGICIDNEDFMIDLPPEASNFIYNFDNKSPEERVLMEPFSFEIDVPEEIINQIGIQEAIDIINKSETLELVEA